MNFLQINDNWKVKGGDGEEKRLDFPHDELVFRQRDYSVGGSSNGFYRSEKLVAERVVDFPHAFKAWLEIEGARAVLDVYIGADCVATITDPSKYLVDVSEYAGTTQKVTLSFLSFDRSADYTGLGLGGGVRLLWASDSLTPTVFLLRPTPTTAERNLRFMPTLRTTAIKPVRLRFRLRP